MEQIPSIELPSPAPSIRFTGRIYPAAVKVNIIQDFTAELVIAPGSPDEGLTARFNFEIKNSEVAVNCYVNRIVQSDNISSVLFHAYEVVRSAVDLLAFSTGIGLTLILDKATYPDGTVTEVFHSISELASLCTAFTVKESSSLLRALVDLAQDRALMLALRDLTETLEDPLHEAVNCARAVEAVARILAPEEEDDNKRWTMLRETLNLNRPYLMGITEHSKGPRHGNYFEESAISNREAQIRAWTVMNRVLEYRKRGNTKLPLSEFPLM